MQTKRKDETDWQNVGNPIAGNDNDQNYIAPDSTTRDALFRVIRIN